MCGITGVYNLEHKQPVQEELLGRMAEAIHHRGPDETAIHVGTNFGIGFKRLSIIDVKHGHQPYFYDDGNLVMVCNGEIYNYKELRNELMQKGHVFKTNCDVEVILPLYKEYGTAFIKSLNGQFAFAIFDKKDQKVILARDHFGICPLFYTQTDGRFIFGSEVKSILEHPLVKRKVNLTGLDQVLSFPGLVSPETMFEGICSLKPGHFIKIDAGEISIQEYWDLDYPEISQCSDGRPETWYTERLEEELLKSVKYRLNADVPVGFYLSGGLDSSLIGGLMKHLAPNTSYASFSIGFPGLDNQEIDERRYQRKMADYVNSNHTEIPFDWSEINTRLKNAIYHSEMPLKETYNTCSLALSRAVSNSDIKVILSGEGADEFFGGYIGYRFDKQRMNGNGASDLEEMLENQVREQLWGDPDFFYEKNQYQFRETKQALYASEINDLFHDFDSIQALAIDRTKLRNRHNLHKRSYLDLKLRLSDHLISDHCDRVTYANSVEGRYPFLDVNLVNFIRTIPPDLKLNGMVEKYILKKVARKFIPQEVYERQKFGFVAPGSPELLRNDIEWINDLLSYDQIKRQGYFNPDVIERLKKQYKKEGFKLNLPFDSDLLIVVITFNIFLELFEMPSFS
ncbi:MAG: asparagine synthase (glutamine-hydrolyzing) [Bacteroidota bacterium]